MQSAVYFSDLHIAIRDKNFDAVIRFLQEPLEDHKLNNINADLIMLGFESFQLMHEIIKNGIELNPGKYQSPLISLLKAKSHASFSCKAVWLYFESLDHQQIHSIFSGKVKEDGFSIHSLLLDNNYKTRDQVWFGIYGLLIERGYIHHLSRRYRFDAVVPSSVLCNLIASPKHIFNVLYQDPTFINREDEEGRTLLHHIVSAAVKESPVGSPHIGLVVGIVSQLSKPYVLAEDAYGMSSLNHCAQNCSNPIVATRLFPYYLKLALHCQHNFNAVDCQGKTLIHYVAESSDFKVTNVNCMKSLLEKVEGINADVCSFQNETALSICVKQKSFEEVESLLVLSATIDPLLGEVDNRNPLKQLHHYSESLKNINWPAGRVSYYENKVVNILYLIEKIQTRNLVSVVSIEVDNFPPLVTCNSVSNLPMASRTRFSRLKVLFGSKYSNAKRRRNSIFSLKKVSSLEANS